MKYSTTRLAAFLCALSFLCLSYSLSRAQSSSKPDPRLETKHESAGPKVQSRMVLTSNTAPVEVATYDSKTKKVANFKGALLSNKFEDGTNITRTGIEKVGDRFFLMRANVGRNSCRSSWTALIDNGKGGLGLAMTTVTTETCTGSPCSWCKLLQKGGPCACGAPLPYKCDHSSTTTTTSRSSILKGPVIHID